MFELTEQTLPEIAECEEGRREVQRSLREIAAAAAAASRPNAAAYAQTLGRLVEILETAAGSTEQELASRAKILEYLPAAITRLQCELEAESADDPFPELIDEVEREWGEWLELVADDPAFDSGWEQETRSEDDPIAAPSEDELAALLSAVANAELSDDEPDDNRVRGENGAFTGAVPSGETPTVFSAVEPAELPSPPPPTRPDMLDSEILEAYLDDASRCLAAIEASVLQFSQQPSESAPLRQMCRELHTLKGASASVGLTDLAAYLHGVEEFIQSRCDSGTEMQGDTEQLLAVVDTVRDQVGRLRGGKSGESPSGEAGPLPGNSSNTSDTSNLGHDSDETVRVKASQLDRLMDMLAELVMLRNGRESRTADLQRLNDELIRCAARLRLEDDARGRQTTRGSNPLREVATDVLEIARSQRTVGDQISTENLAVSRFIRNFRQELTEVRRLPVSGLFHRLQRAVHDAARIEQKQVRLEMLGGHAGLERSLQEKLYEPLLHIVRNSVSHGIETEEVRRAAGKPPCGTVTLEARGASNLLILEIRDDGKGLDYEAIRRRGVERGILSAEQNATREELAQLIFHPGFSTREGANAVAGRGVGMDVVAEAIERMRSWIEVESTPGQGTKIRLSIPLRSVIEHTMVFRAGRQLFAVPMQYVRSADEAGASSGEEAPPAVSLNDLFGSGVAETDQPRQRLVIGFGSGVDSQASTPRREVSLLVDELVGPEEVVVRPLPPLLRHQTLVSGVTLSGTGELLLLFDSQRLIERGTMVRPEMGASATVQQTAKKHRPRILVVDDSISARRSLTRPLKQFGFETVEAGDGMEALELLRDGDFAAVFSDMEMPKAGGLDLLRGMSDWGKNRQTPILIVSSRDDEETRSQARELGATAYLAKPAAEAQIAGELRQLGLLNAASVEGEIH